MKNKFLLLFLFVSIIGIAQKVYQKNYYPDGSIQEEGWIKDNVKHDFWKFYYQNGKIKEKGHYKNGLKHKYWYFYRENSSKIKEGHYVNGIENKWWSYFNKDGQLIHKCQLRDNKKNGYCLVYKQNKLVKASKFVNDKKIKEWTDFSSFKRENNLNDLK
ncbi:toxin-antitoxin system YwqK family antitoxin [Tenacibaculum agarivorans]|uniref:toxin-antitoxin system YwqK family antitoxin n=1 Tax=Tenacibaculum agarivorans TaxID=1908389 RepID=UPI00094B9312|nr:hypothetical protein [Tenacibaculum agarivorans]